MPISALALGVRAYNCLDGESIRTVGQLVAWKEPDLLRVRNFGQTTLDEIKSKLVEIGLDLGMEVPASISVEPAGMHISAAIPQDPMVEYHEPISEEPQVPAPDLEEPVPGPADAGDSDAEASVDSSAGTI